MTCMMMALVLKNTPLLLTMPTCTESLSRKLKGNPDVMRRSESKAPFSDQVFYQFAIFATELY